ncbi:MAG: Wzt carbohydrate-binding domain-containing protein [Candidatus Woesearchaeota archaeon]|nr:Wzt carbohydrate-binding domain-containing protein [Candidatus Woesearchaeota archaeon]
MKPIIELVNVSKVYSNQKNGFGLHNLTLKVHRSESIGIIGANGAGKTTFLKLLGGILKPSSGEIRLDGNVLPFLDIGSCLQEDLNGIENIFLYGSILGMEREDIKNNLERIIDFSEIGHYANKKVKEYSNGMKLRLVFSIMIFCRTDILLIDEVLAVGDINFQMKCLSRVNLFRKNGGTVILVSHDMELIRNMCDRTILLDNGRIAKIGPSFEVVSYYLSLNDKNKKDTVKKILSRKLENLNKLKKDLETIKSKGTAIWFQKKRKIDELSRKINEETLNLIDFINDELSRLKTELDNINCDNLSSGQKTALLGTIDLIKSMLNLKEGLCGINDGDRIWLKYIYSLGYSITGRAGDSLFNDKIDLFVDILTKSKNASNIKSTLEEFRTALILIDLETTPNDVIISSFLRYGEINHKLRIFTELETNTHLKNFARYHMILIEEQLNSLRLISAFEPTEEVHSKISKLTDLRESLAKYMMTPLEQSDTRKKASILDVAIMDKTGFRKQTFNTGERLNLTIHYHAHKLIRNPVFGIAIFKDDGTLICGPNTKFDGIRIPDINGKGKISFAIEKLPLLSGIYYVSATIHTQDNIYPIDQHDKRYMFEVTGKNNKDIGLLKLKSSWTIGEKDNNS